MASEKKARTRKAVDPKEKLRALRLDVDKKAAVLSAAQEKLKEEEHKQLERNFEEIRKLSVKLGADISDVAELLRLYVEKGISLSAEINKLKDVQLDFETISESRTPAGNESHGDSEPVPSETDEDPDNAVNKEKNGITDKAVSA